MATFRTRSVEILDGEGECMECGYIEEGRSNRRPKRCPDCNAVASVFEFFEYEDEDWEEDDSYEDSDDEYDDYDDDYDDFDDDDDS